jgi:NAD-dependent deacetylase
MSPPDFDQAIEQAAALLRGARYGVALTGAGISTPSGIPDFRSSGSGLWQQSDPMKVASLSSFRRTPRVFFDWLRPLAATISQAQPNPAHRALAELEQAGLLKAIITQNIDGLHQRAGSRTVLEVHGSMNTLTCPGCRQGFPGADYYPALVASGGLPHCPRCQTILKPDVILFEEALSMTTWNAAEQHCRLADVLLVVGSSLEVMPVAGLPVAALENNAAVIINNFSATYLDELARVLLPMDVAQALPRIVKRVL